MTTFEDDFNKDFPSNEFQEEPSAFTEALEEGICGGGKALDYPETEHPPIEDIIF